MSKPRQAGDTRHDHHDDVTGYPASDEDYEWFRCVLCGCEGGDEFLDTRCHRNPVPHSPWMQGPHECDPVETV